MAAGFSTRSMTPPRPSATATRVSAPRDVALGPEVVLVPVKAFHQAKRRLGTSLGDSERIGLVRAMAERVLAACAPLPVAVVCDDEAVADRPDAADEARGRRARLRRPRPRR